MSFDPTLFLFDLAGALVGLGIALWLGRRVVDRWYERERARQEWHIVQRLRWDELVRGRGGS